MEKGNPIYVFKKPNMVCVKPTETESAHDENFVSKFLILLMNSGGIPVYDQKYGKLVTAQKFFLINSFIFLTTSQVMALKFSVGLHEMTSVLYFILNGCFLNIPTIVLHAKKQNFFNISMTASHSFDRNASVKFKKFFCTYGVTYIGIYTFMLLSPILFLPLSSNKTWTTTNLIIPSWFPWTINTRSKWFISAGLQFFWLSVLSFPILCIFLFTAYFILEVKFQFDRLYQAIQLTNDGSLPVINMNWATGDALTILKACIHRHQIISRYE